MAKGSIKRMILSLYSQNNITSDHSSLLLSNLWKALFHAYLKKFSFSWVFILMLFFFITLVGCKERISLPDFDNKAWQQDKGGCLGQRKILLQKLLTNKNKLKGYSTEDIVEFLGRPDKKNLYNRNQKFFYYYSEPGKHCIDPKSDSESKIISIRFSALDRATEIIYY